MNNSATWKIEYISEYKEKIVIAMLRDWYDQHWKAEYGKDHLLAITSHMEGKISNISSVPVSGGGGNKIEDQLCAGLDKKVLAEYGYNNAREYVDEMSQTLARLTDDERYMLEVRFIERDEGRGIEKIMDKYYISKTEAYRRSNDALKRLTKLIFW